jgi:hypothetical protein
MGFVAKEYPPAGYYVFRIFKVEDGPKSEWGDSIKWYLEILDGKKILKDSTGLPFEIQILTSNKVSPKSRSGKIIAAVFGVPADMVELSTLYDTLVDGEFGGMLSTNAAGYPEISQDVTSTNPKPMQVAS